MVNKININFNQTAAIVVYLNAIGYDSDYVISI